MEILGFQPKYLRYPDPGKNASFELLIKMLLSYSCFVLEFQLNLSEIKLVNFPWSGAEIFDELSNFLEIHSFWNVLILFLYLCHCHRFFFHFVFLSFVLSAFFTKSLSLRSRRCRLSSSVPISFWSSRIFRRFSYSLLSKLETVFVAILWFYVYVFLKVNWFWFIFLSKQFPVRLLCLLVLSVVRLLYTKCIFFS